MSNDIINNKISSIRSIRSFVCRRGHFTKGQKYAINTYLPVMGLSYKRENINLFNVFGSLAPINIEIGFGMGDSLVNMASMYTKQNFIGIEVHLPGIGACLAKANNAGLSNLRIIYHDAIEVLENMIPDNSLSRLQIFFPDPWPKKRHNKRRIIKPLFVNLVQSKLCVGGIFHIATDWKPYANYILEVMNAARNLHNYNGNLVSRTLTKYEKRGKKLGHCVFDLIFEKIFL